ncbi:hypothetical protein Ahy_A02g005435 [Arachis hypogaea]|uniref:Plant heme peroxidase family profile domain-containing protein n=1 Tax=Arachis hypogaea TaxID=3818 RepID=A0A445E6T8_ARAHY|nr:hypothetical protein Ahy_A02g005435 [Arachis hypogaea]
MLEIPEFKDAKVQFDAISNRYTKIDIERTGPKEAHLGPTVKEADQLNQQSKQEDEDHHHPRDQMLVPSASAAGEASAGEASRDFSITKSYIYNDTNINAFYAKFLQSKCLRTENDRLLELFDRQTSFHFGNLYYKNLVQKKVLLHSNYRSCTSAILPTIRGENMLELHSLGCILKILFYLKEPLCVGIESMALKSTIKFLRDTKKTVVAKNLQWQKEVENVLPYHHLSTEDVTLQNHLQHLAHGGLRSIGVSTTLAREFRNSLVQATASALVSARVDVERLNGLKKERATKSEAAAALTEGKAKKFQESYTHVFGEKLALV